MPDCDAEFDAMEAAYAVSLTTQSAENAAYATYLSAQMANQAAMMALMDAYAAYDQCMMGSGGSQLQVEPLPRSGGMLSDKMNLIRDHIDGYVRRKREGKT